MIVAVAALGATAASAQDGWNFENGLQGWSAEGGPAFRNQPVCGALRVEQVRQAGDKLARLGGDYWHGPFDVGQQGRCRIDSQAAGLVAGSLSSPAFMAGPATQFLSFLVGGAPSARVELRAQNGRVLLTENAGGTTTMRRVLWNLGKYFGQPVRVVLAQDAIVPGPAAKDRPQVLRITKDFQDCLANAARVAHDNPSAAKQLNETCQKSYDLLMSRVPVVAPGAEIPRGMLADDFRFSNLPTATRGAPVWGFADLHAHLFNHMGFGGNMLFGSIHSSIGPRGAISDGASDIAKALPTCIRSHGIGFGGGTMTVFPEGGHQSEGFPNFRGWPHFYSLAHQQAYVDWLRRAWLGGLRLVQVDVGNHPFLAKAWEQIHAGMVQFSPLTRNINPPEDAWNVAAQLKAAHDFVKLPDVRTWAEIARTPAEARRIIGQGKLALVMGIEIEDAGDLLVKLKGFGQPTRKLAGADAAAVRKIIRQALEELFTDPQKEVRHIIPVHTTDNWVGAPAVYEHLFDIANLIQRGHLFPLRNAFKDGIRVRDDLGLPFAGNAAVGDFVRKYFPWVHNGPATHYLLNQEAAGLGHAHALGLNDAGKIFVQEMMRLGMFVDADHMSDLSIGDTIQIAESVDYPIQFSHTGFRELSFGNWTMKNNQWAKNDAVGFTPKGADAFGMSKADAMANERSHSAAQLAKVAKLGGIVGIGTGGGSVPVGYPFANPRVAPDCDGSSKVFVQNYLYAFEKLGGRGIAIGTDINGLNGMAGPRFGPFACFAAAKDPIRKRVFSSQVPAQQKPVKYSGPFASGEANRFNSDTGFYDVLQRQAWEAIARFRSGTAQEPRPRVSDVGQPVQRDVENLAWGFSLAARGAPRPSKAGIDTHAHWRMGWDVFKGQHNTDFDDRGANEEKVRAVWTRWLQMEAGTNAPLDKSYAGATDFDINIDGLAHIGLLPDFIQDAKNVGLNEKDLAPLFRSAEDYIVMWEKMERQKSVARAMFP